MSTPRQCRSCNSEMKDVRLCLVCYTAHQLDLPSNRGHSKIECTNPWHGEGVAAPLEPSRKEFSLQLHIDWLAQDEISDFRNWLIEKLWTKEKEITALRENE